jgi:hypothetical protein
MTRRRLTTAERTPDPRSILACSLLAMFALIAWAPLCSPYARGQSISPVDETKGWLPWQPATGLTVRDTARGSARVESPSLTSHPPAALATTISLDSARACAIESGWRLPDCAAELGVIMRRSARTGWQFSRMLHAYSAIDHNTRRARAVRAWPDGDVHGLTAGENERWRELRAFAASVLRGNEANPRPGSDHWGSGRGVDGIRARRAIDAGEWRVVHGPGRTLNTYYAIRWGH